MNANRAFVGSLAPDFHLPSTPRQETGDDHVSLADYRGRWLALIFYPRDFSLVCPTELTALNSRIDDFRRQGCDLLGISSDSVESHQRWIDTAPAQGGLGGLAFPLASDVDGSVCRAYGVFLEQQHVALRGLFIIDPNGVLQYHVVHNLSVGRRSEEVLRVLAALQTGGLCAEGWNPAQATLDAPRRLGPGSVVSHYRIERQVGSGTFSAVFRAQDTTLERTVALKVMKPDSPVPASAVLAEARAAAALNHPNVCTIYSVDEAEGVPVIAMEYLSGRPLSKHIAGRPLAPEMAANVARQIASGMAAAHENGVTHGDLKPANVFVTDAGLVKILDFGLARRETVDDDPDATADLAPGADGAVTGTPSYMSPEQAGGFAPTAASDVFALGAMLYEMLTGRQAFSGANVLQTLRKIRDVVPEKLTGDVTEPFASLLSEMLVRHGADRTITMAEVAERLAASAPQLAPTF